jgi:hypothetical protein
MSYNKKCLQEQSGFFIKTLMQLRKGDRFIHHEYYREIAKQTN